MQIDRRLARLEGKARADAVRWQTPPKVSERARRTLIDLGLIYWDEDKQWWHPTDAKLLRELLLWRMHYRP